MPRRRRHFICTPLALALLALTLPAHGADAPAAPPASAPATPAAPVPASAPAAGNDAASVKAAARAYFKAVAAGDLNAAASMAIANEKQLKVLAAMLPMMQAFHAAEQAAVAKFGAEGHGIFQAPGQANPTAPVTPDYDKDIDGAKVDVVGDMATLTPDPASATQKEPLKLKKDKGQWKIDYTMLDVTGMDNPQFYATADKLTALGKQLAADIAAGKYASLDISRNAVTQKMTAAMIEAATPPPPPPATDGAKPDGTKAPEPKK